MNCNNSSKCVCDLYYDPDYNCTMNFFQVLPGPILYVYSILELICIITISVLSGLELILDIKYKGIKFFKNKTSIIKISYIPYVVCQIVANSLFILDVTRKSPDYILIELIFRYITIGLLCFVYILAVVSWLELLIKSKNLGFNSKPVKVFKIILLILAFVGISLAILGKLLSYFNLILPYSNYLANYTIVISVLIPIIIITVYIIKTLCTLPSIDSASGTIKKVKRKTIYITVANVIMILNFILLVATVGLTTDTSPILIFRLSFTLLIQFLVSLFLYLFIRKYPVIILVYFVKNIPILLSISGRTSSSSTTSTEVSI